MEHQNFQPGSRPPGNNSGASIGLGATAATIISALSDTSYFENHPVIHTALICATIIVTVWCHRAESDGLRALLRESLSEISHEFTTARISAYREKFQAARRYNRQRPARQ